MCCGYTEPLPCFPAPSPGLGFTAPFDPDTPGEEVGAFSP